jgi:amidase
VRGEGAKIPYKGAKIFKDVKQNHWAASYIEAAYRMGLIKGYPDGKYRPNNKVNKAESVAILARFDRLALMPVETKPYQDVNQKYWAAKYIQAAKEAGMLSYVSDTRFRPKEEVSRAETVEMMSKTSIAMKQIDDLLSWDRGFEFEISRPTIRASL